MTVRREIAEPRRETGARSPYSCRTVRVRGASPPARGTVPIRHDVIEHGGSHETKYGAGGPD
jgi:hypothetical protein